jgi:hypothetical protein
MPTAARDPDHLQEGHPEHPVMLEAGSRDDGVEGLVLEGQDMRILQHQIHTPPRHHVHPEIAGRMRRAGAERAVDVLRPEIEDPGRPLRQVGIEEGAAEGERGVVHGPSWSR